MRNPRISIVHNPIEGLNLYRITLNLSGHQLPLGYIDETSIDEYKNTYLALGYDVFVHDSDTNTYIRA